MSETTINFGDKKVNKSNFWKNKKIFKIEDININKVLVSKKEPYGTKKLSKYIIGYNDGDYIVRLHIKLPQMTRYVKCFDNNKAMSFKVTDNNLLEKYTEIWRRVNNLMNIKFDSEPVYGDVGKYLMTKIKMYKDRMNTNFQGKEVPKENASYKCLSLVVLDSIIRANKKYYPQTLLEECKYEIKKNKMENLINDESDNEFDNEFGNETDNEDCVLIINKSLEYGQNRRIH